MIITSKATYLAHAGLLSILGTSVEIVGGGVDGAARRALEAFGVMISPASFLAGMLFAIAGGFVAMAVTIPEDRIDKIGTLSVATLVGVFASLMQPNIALVEHWPPQVVMGVAGVSSRKIIEMIRNLDISALFKRGPK